MQEPGRGGIRVRGRVVHPVPRREKELAMQKP